MPQPGPALVFGITALAGVTAGVAFLPWARWPRQLQASPALAFYVALGLLRHSTGGSVSGLAPLAALPVVWLALYGTRVETMTAVAGCGTMFLAPMVLVGAPLYPIQDWHRAALWSAVAIVLGTSIQRLVRSREQQAAGLETLLSLTRHLDDATPAAARQRACLAAAEIMRASFCALMEPDGQGNLVSTATTGMDLPRIVIPLSGQASGSLVAFNAGQRLVVADTTDNPLISQQLVAATGAASMVFEPIRRLGQVIGVLSIGYSTAQATLDPKATAILELVTQQLAALTTRIDLLNRLEALAADASDMVSRYELTDDGFRYSYTSRSTHTLLGRQPETLLGTPPKDLIHPDDRAALAPTRANLLAGQSVTTGAYRAAHADGHWVWLESTVRPILDVMTGRVAEVQATSRDVSDRRRAELELRQAHLLFAGVLDAATEYSIIGTNPEGTVNVFNTGAERMLGYRAAEIIGRATPLRLHDPSEVAQRAEELGVEPGFEAIVALARHEQIDRREWTYLTKDRRRLHVSLTVTAVRDPEGQISGFICIARDLADQDKATKAVEEAQQREQAIIARIRTIARARDEVISSATRDPQVPLTGVLGYDEVLLDSGTATADSPDKVLAVPGGDAAQLLRLIDDLVAAARI